MKTHSEILNNPAFSAEQRIFLQKIEDCSPFAARMLLRDNDLLTDLLENLSKSYSLAEMQNFLKNLQINDEATLKIALRKLRQRVMLRIIARDLNGLAGDGLAGLLEVMQTTSQLAECTINTAIDYLNTWLVDAHGQPVDVQGYPQNFIVIGMGKLGGGELNVSSDIDLIFAYESEGETQSERPISNQDFFTKLAKKLIAVIDEITEDGFVFRVDMRLRPFGSEGALVSNLDALEEYYQNNGREWERYAWIKGREVTGGNQVSKLLKPFVFRKYLDFGAFASMRDLKIQIQRDVNNKGMFDNIKLGRGGIREIEFIAQVFQLIRGGQDVSLQIKPTLEVLKLLKNKGLLPEKTVTELTEAYVFLRNLEHRLMYVEDAQTQELPKSDEAKARIARAMNFANWSDFTTQLNNHRNVVQQHFDATFSEEKAEPNALETEKNLWNGVLNTQESLAALENLGFANATETLRRVQTLHQSSRYLQLPEASRLRFDALMPHVLSLAATQDNAEVTLNRMIDLLESICRRASYLALLAEHKDALHLLVKLCSSSPWLSQYLTQHPILLDELLDTRTLYAPPDFIAMRAELVNRLAEFDGDIERQMDVMRHFKHAHIFRFAAQDINGELSLETLSDYLSALADLILSVSLVTIWPNVRGKHCDEPKFAVIGYGKLGGKELGYASDLDIIFLYDDDASEASEIYARFAQRINNWFNSLTSAGLLYETDLQLRPDGNSGLLVSSVTAFREYQRSKAWVWEHQALTRARYVAGDTDIGVAFEQIRREVIAQVRDATSVKAEVSQMREKMRAAQHIPVDKFDIKHSTGGIIDVEFLVQYFVMYYANKHTQLTENIGNIALLKMLSELGLIDAALAQKVINAYRAFRQQQHLLKLQGAAQMQVDASIVAEHVQAVNALWQAVFTQK
ncbi:MAG TPA: bifunctional [glutamate--ammonia ligase]-adenylyl-L-tyrosine phosphorylase/[glutamate--ammonia-ligase] adenylyltransferase [Methylotenera sp.]|nr:bifunctional [glutamate--ammonia ligase]-adenylyl-L-tyrosine phosphorylase/[glutamate--ammonia-ligase] adenylyltransferase [Methylotenera sp.]HPH06367.1 bifunctional [glutamate--ammonia ligase]-adenylyl-L-tyrosine phosphorylase/[glutamate--ammonia-ligase] adenylyltransferase [Methylotenera sp.]HPN00814.1 bifunctional [glutamate--ammonia ligase]-adenylyl-L-tyrosine phosphorylase/[glutamate--ammonia-ligase] adenylyltransferase [Methylotenera sp.]